MCAAAGPLQSWQLCRLTSGCCPARCAQLRPVVRQTGAPRLDTISGCCGAKQCDSVHHGHAARGACRLQAGSRWCIRCTGEAGAYEVACSSVRVPTVSCRDKSFLYFINMIGYQQSGRCSERCSPAPGPVAFGNQRTEGVDRGCETARNRFQYPHHQHHEYMMQINSLANTR